MSQNPYSDLDRNRLLAESIRDGRSSTPTAAGAHQQPHGQHPQQHNVNHNPHMSPQSILAAQHAAAAAHRGFSTSTADQALLARAFRSNNAAAAAAQQHHHQQQHAAQQHYDHHTAQQQSVGTAAALAAATPGGGGGATAYDYERIALEYRQEQALRQLQQRQIRGTATAANVTSPEQHSQRHTTSTNATSSAKKGNKNLLQGSSSYAATAANTAPAASTVKGHPKQTKPPEPLRLNAKQASPEEASALLQRNYSDIISVHHSNSKSGVGGADVTSPTAGATTAYNQSTTSTNRTTDKPASIKNSNATAATAIDVSDTSDNDKEQKVIDICSSGTSSSDEEDYRSAAQRKIQQQQQQQRLEASRRSKANKRNLTSPSTTKTKKQKHSSSLQLSEEQIQSIRAQANKDAQTALTSTLPPIPNVNATAATTTTTDLLPSTAVNHQRKNKNMSNNILDIPTFSKTKDLPALAGPYTQSIISGVSHPINKIDVDCEQAIRIAAKGILKYATMTKNPDGSPASCSLSLHGMDSLAQFVVDEQQKVVNKSVEEAVQFSFIEMMKRHHGILAQVRSEPKGGGGSSSSGSMSKQQQQQQQHPQKYVIDKNAMITNHQEFKDFKESCIRKSQYEIAKAQASAKIAKLEEMAIQNKLKKMEESHAALITKLKKEHEEFIEKLMEGHSEEEEEWRVELERERRSHARALNSYVTASCNALDLLQQHGGENVKSVP